MMPDGTMLQPLSGSACSTDYVEIPGIPEPQFSEHGCQTLFVL